MAEDTERFPTISVTVTPQQRRWLKRREQVDGIPVSRSVRDALDKTYPAIQQDEEAAEPKAKVA